jgi:hypothetical protein
MPPQQQALFVACKHYKHSIMTSTDTLNLISLLASIASLILAIVAIWLSFKFFDKSNEASDKTIEASKGISASVERLEKLFDKLYSDTFTIMKDTVSDMRKHIWTDKDNNKTEVKIEEEIEKKAQTKVSVLKEELSQDISKILSRQHLNTDAKITALKDELQGLIEKAVNQTRTLETKVREETVRDYIMRRLRVTRRIKKKITAGDIVDRAMEEGFGAGRVITELEKMKADGLISFEGDTINKSSDEIILL